MGKLPVVAQPLAVVAGHRHHGLPGQAALLERRQQAADLLVDRGDLAIIGTPGMALAVRRRRRVGGMGVVQVDPEEEGTGVIGPGRGEPGEGAVDHLPARPFGFEGRAGDRIPLDLVIVDLEPAPQAEPAVEHEGADEGAGAVALRREQRGQGGRPLGEGADAVVAQAVMRRQKAGEHAGVRWEGERHRRRGLREAHPVARQAVEPGRFGCPVAIRADSVGSHRVEGHEQQIRAWRSSSVPAGAPPEDQDCGTERQEKRIALEQSRLP